MALELTEVEFGPFTTGERPEPLMIRISETLKDDTTKPLELHGKTPEWVANVYIQPPGGGVKVTRVATIVDPASLPTDDPDNFTQAEEGWIRVEWAADDFAVAGSVGDEFEVQVDLDNQAAGGTLRLVSQTVYVPVVRDGPAS